MADWVFISFSSADQKRAVAVCEALERSGLRCWVSYRDVRPSENYQAAIVQALKSSKALVLVFSARTNLSTEVSKELSLASTFKVSVFPLRIENVMPEGALHYELATHQWIDAFDDWEAALGDLVRSVHEMGDLHSPRDLAPPPAPVHKRADIRIPEQTIEAARSALAHYIGPIALILVRKAAAAADSLDDFHDRLARQISAPDDRTAFLSRVRRHPHIASSPPKA